MDYATYTIWAVWDYADYEISSSPQPELVRLFAIRKDAWAFATAVNSEPHPSADLGYEYDFRVMSIDVWNKMP